MLKAECGDAFRLRYLGSDNMYHNIFIDSGFSRTFRHSIDFEIQSITEKSERIDLWVISHIHDDHIGGALKYIDTILDRTRNDIVDTWYYNPPRNYNFEPKKLKSTSSAMSIGQADKLYEYLKSTNKLLEFDITNELPSINLFGLTITILTPNTECLKLLREKYNTATQFEKEESQQISQAISVMGNDYHIPFGEFDLDNFQEDNSIENQSSISMLIEFKGNNSLWLADSFSSDIANSLQRLGYNKENPLICEYVKVSHHGSSGSNASSLFDVITCSNYLISSNGENKYNLPNKECLARIIRNPQRNMNTKYKLYFNYDNTTLRRVFDIDGTAIFDELNFETLFLD